MRGVGDLGGRRPEAERHDHAALGQRHQIPAVVERRSVPPLSEAVNDDVVREAPAQGQDPPPTARHRADTKRNPSMVPSPLPMS